MRTLLRALHDAVGHRLARELDGDVTVQADDGGAKCDHHAHRPLQLRRKGEAAGGARREHTQQLPRCRLRGKGRRRPGNVQSPTAMTLPPL